MDNTDMLKHMIVGRSQVLAILAKMLSAQECNHT